MKLFRIIILLSLLAAIVATPYRANSEDVFKPKNMVILMNMDTNEPVLDDDGVAQTGELWGEYTPEGQHIGQLLVLNMPDGFIGPPTIFGE
jgi:hypothetical protein